LAAKVIERTMSGDRCSPSPQAVPVAGKRAEVAGDLYPGLGRHVFGIDADQTGQIKQQGGPPAW
jgi:hypothetical protein